MDGNLKLLICDAAAADLFSPLVSLRFRRPPAALG